jgi:hypothetical protein
MRCFAAIGLLLLPLVGCSGEDDACVHREACSGASVFELGVFSPTDIEPLGAYASIEGCLNATCRQRIVDMLPAPGEGVSLASQVVTPDPQLVIVLSRVDSPDNVSISVSLGADSSLLHDGDTYKIALTAGDGRPLAERMWSATYQITQSGDSRCGECSVTAAVTPL